jgi:heptosyltransferase-1
LTAVAPLLRAAPGRRSAGGRPAVLLLRLERVGDLLMTLGAIRQVRRLAPDAAIDLVVGTWNEPLARLISEIDRVETLDAPWLSRHGSAESAIGLLARARGWRSRGYDLAVNFEGDIRSHLLMALSGARRTVGFDMAGGGPLLTDRVAYNPREHVAANALRLVERAFGCPPAPEGDSRTSGPQPPTACLEVPEAASSRAAALLGLPTSAAATAPRPSRGLLRTNGAGSPRLVGLHAGGGREIKQWDPGRAAEVATLLARSYGATIVLTGSAADHLTVDRVKSGLAAGVKVIDLSGSLDLVTLAAVLEKVDLLVTPDTGPMHLAAAVGTPIVAIFGPSDPARWGPLSPVARVVRIDLPCSPCNRIRVPPRRCVGRVPDCLAGIDVERVYEAAVELLGPPPPASPQPASPGAVHVP